MELIHEQKAKAYTFLADSFESKIRNDLESNFLKSVNHMMFRNLILCEIEKLFATNDILLNYFTEAMINLEGTGEASRLGYLKAAIHCIASDLSDFKSKECDNNRLRAQIHRLVQENRRLQDKLDSIGDIMKK